MRIEQTQKQSLRLTAEMRQSLTLLQLPAIELQQLVAEQVEKNPFLEYTEGVGEPEPVAVRMQAKAPAQPVVLSDNVALALAKQQADTPYTSENLAAWDEYATEPWDRLGAVTTFTEYLLEQLGELSLPKSRASLCSYLIQDLDERGYLTDSLPELVQETGCSYQELYEAIEIVQGLQPRGVGARSLRECLLLQLEGPLAKNEVLVQLIKEDLEALGAKDYAKLGRKYRLSRERLRGLENIISGLNPLPSRGYAGGEATVYVVPEATVDENLQVELKEGNQPKLHLNKTYVKMLQQGCDPTTEAYLREYFHKAELLLKGLGEREKTLSRLIKQLVAKQPGYFKKGFCALVPMTLRDMAEALQVHESTISRAIKDKYIVGPQGPVGLKALFSAKVGNTEAAAAAGAIKATLKGLLQEENKTSPYSDRELGELLAKADFTLSRRTVAKYREEMGIAGAAKRRVK